MPDTNRWASDDVIAADRRASVPTTLPVAMGTVLTHRATGTTGRVVGFSEGQRVILQDESGRRHEFLPVDGFFEHDGSRVALRSAPRSQAQPRGLTASGSIHAGDRRAGVARASRIWVEGIHDAELVEKIWGDDLRAASVVVEPLHGADDLVSMVRAFEPSPHRRLGILLDHLVEGSKEWRIAVTVVDEHVLVTGHPFVDVWQAIKPAAAGITAWPAVTRDEPWKDGVVRALGVGQAPGRFWRHILASVSSYADIETPLVNAVERLIDFVTTDAY